MATLATINEAGAALGDTFSERPIIRVIADTNYVYGEKGAKRNAEPLDITNALTTNDIIRYTVPAGGPFVTGPPQLNTLVEAAEALLSPLAPIPANTLTDPMTTADVLLFTEVSEAELASGALRRLTLTSSDVAFVDETYAVDYSLYDEQLFESDLYGINERTLTFDTPIRDSPQKTRIHRVFINANTADVTIAFANTWKQHGTRDDAKNIVIPNGENRTLEFTASKSDADDFVRVLGEGAGLRGKPVTDATALTALTAKDYEKRKTLDTDSEWVFELGRTPTGTDLADDAATGAWVKVAVASIPTEFEVLYDGVWGTGRSLANSHTWDTVKSQFSEIHISLRFGATASAFAGAIPTDELTDQRQYRYGQDDAERAVFTVRTPFSSGLFDAVATSLSGANQVIIRGKKRKQFSTIEFADLPSSFADTTVGGTVDGNNFTVNGMYRGNNTGPISGSGFGNWTWRIRVQRIGDYLSHHYFNDSGNTGFRESYDGGTSWSAWAV